MSIIELVVGVGAIVGLIIGISFLGVFLFHFRRIRKLEGKERED